MFGAELTVMLMREALVIQFRQPDFHLKIEMHGILQKSCPRTVIRH